MGRRGCFVTTSDEVGGGQLKKTTCEWGAWLVTVAVFGCQPKASGDGDEGSSGSGSAGGATEGTGPVPGQSDPQGSGTEGGGGSSAGPSGDHDGDGGDSHGSDTHGSVTTGSTESTATSAGMDSSGTNESTTTGDHGSSSESTRGQGDTGQSTTTGQGGDDLALANAHDIAVRRVSVNQGTDSALAEAGMLLLSPSVPLVPQRRALFSAWWELDPGFVARDVIGRLTLEPPLGDVVVYEQTLYIAGATGADLSAPHFEWSVPPESVQQGTRYVVSFHEIEADAPGPADPPRLPVEGWAELELDPTPRDLRIELVPYRHVDCGATAHVDAGVVADMEAFLTSYLPVGEVHIDVHEQVDFSGTMFPMDGVLDHLTALRGQEGPASDVFYYGYLNPCEFQAEQYCGGGLAWRDPEGIVVSPGYRAGVGGPPCNTPDPDFADIDLQTMVHELSHNFGRAHVNCSGMEAGVDPNYPHPNGTTGTWGWDIQTQEVHEPTDVDFMGYCIAGYDWWSSDYGWAITVEQLGAVNLDASDPIALYGPQVLLTIHPDGRRTTSVIRVAPPSRTDAWVEVSRSDRFDTERIPAAKVYVADSDAERYVFTPPAGRLDLVERVVFDSPRGPLEFSLDGLR